jgi:hypothetical protein
VDQSSFRAVWEAELDRLELDVVRVERLLSGVDTAPSAVQGAAGEPWSPPVVPGPMPADLLPRARDILERQSWAEGALREALSSAQRQLAYGSRVSDATAPGRAKPVYVDLEA